MQEVKRPNEPAEQFPIIGPGHTFATITDKISALTLKRRTPLGWYLGFAFFFGVAQLLAMTVTYLVTTGIGIWG